MKKKKDRFHLIGGIRHAACGAKVDWKTELGTIFLSSVTCEDCKATALYKQKDKKRKPSVPSVSSVANNKSVKSV
jgi:hypothetical protein